MNVLNRTRAQGSAEYLILLGAVMVVALVVISLMSYSFGTAAGISEAESKVYWTGEARPFRVLEAVHSRTLQCPPGNTSAIIALVVDNTDLNNASVTAFTIDGVSRTFCAPGGAAAARLPFGSMEKRTVYVQHNTSCSAGSLLALSLNITYDKSGFSGRIQQGQKKLAVVCT